MRVPANQSAILRAASVAGMVLLAGCAATAPSQRFRSFFLPPSPPVPPEAEAIPEPPPLLLDFYASEAPSIGSTLPSIPRPSDADFVIKRAEDRYASGKRAVQEGRLEEARRQFNRAIEILMAAPEDMADRTRIERRLEEMVESIYQYDTEDLGAGSSPEDNAAPPQYDKRPIDEILEMTFPVDPTLRNKVREQVQATRSQLPLEESDAVVSFINFFSSPRGKKILAAGLKRSGRYKPMIEKALAEEGLPQELIFLAQAESGFQPIAISNKLCVGLWQFAKFRGEEYGLEVNSMVDMRRDPEMATRAAARHLHDLYTHLGDWYLAMAAYDCGPLCIDRAVERTGYADFWALRRAGVLPAKETENYVPAILAMIIVAKNAADYGLEEVTPDPPMEFDSVELEAPTGLALAAAAVDAPLSALKDLNPAVLKTVAPAGYRMHIPKGTASRLEEAFAIIPANRRDSWRVARVDAGDTFATLARRYGTSADALAAANRDGLPEAGQLVAIPTAIPVVAQKKTRAVAAVTAKSPSKRPVAISPGAKTARGRTAASKTPSGAPKRKATAKASAKAATQRQPGA
jgi:membrane-bound lytic murein transglycosylase D